METKDASNITFELDFQCTCRKKAEAICPIMLFGIYVSDYCVDI